MNGGAAPLAHLLLRRLPAATHSAHSNRCATADGRLSTALLSTSQAFLSFREPEWESVSEPGRAFVEGLLDLSPETRMTSAEALSARGHSSWLSREAQCSGRLRHNQPTRCLW